MPALPTSRVKMSIEAQVAAARTRALRGFPVRAPRVAPHPAVIACMPQGLASKDWTSKSDPIGVIYAVSDTGAETVSAVGELRCCGSHCVDASRPCLSGVPLELARADPVDPTATTRRPCIDPQPALSAAGAGAHGMDQRLPKPQV